MYCSDPTLLPLLEGMNDTPCGAGSLAAASMQGAFSLAALDALSGGGGSAAAACGCSSGGSVGSTGAVNGSVAGAVLPPAEELAAALIAESPLIASSGPDYGGTRSGDATGGRPASDVRGGSPGAAAAAAAANGAAAAATATAAMISSPPPPMTLQLPDHLDGPTPTPFLTRSGSISNRIINGGSAPAPLARMGSTGGGLARAGSISTKKASPNRVCCNALLASYARALPAQWRRALALLEGMWVCGGELTPDIVR